MKPFVHSFNKGTLNKLIITNHIKKMVPTIKPFPVYGGKKTRNEITAIQIINSTRVVYTKCTKEEEATESAGR